MFYTTKRGFVRNLFLTYYSQSAMHLIKHPTDRRVSAKNRNNTPTIIVPIMLVAANSIPRSKRDAKIVIGIDVRKIDRIGQAQYEFCVNGDTRSRIAQ